MKKQVPQICFGLNDELDRSSLANVLQLLGRKDFAELLCQRLDSKEIMSTFDSITLLLHKHLSEDEYHEDFLQDRQKKL